jgi:hypothetical protein
MSLAVEQEPRWPQRLAWLGLAAVLALMAFETQVWRPGWGIGDETLAVRFLLAGLDGEAWSWHWFQGSLQRAALTALAALSRPWMGGLHLHGIFLLLLEAALVAALARRWWGREVAAWAVLALVVTAGAWMRYRSLQPFQAAPVAGLACLWLALRVQGAGAALAAGALAGALAMEYEVTAMAIAGMLALGWAREAPARRWAPWVVGGALLTGLAVMATDLGRLGAYTEVRGGIYAGGGWVSALQGLAANLRGAFLGGPVLPSVGVVSWPSVAPWSWPALGLGLTWAWRRERFLAEIAVILFCLPITSLQLWGLPLHRLHGAAPALALLTGLGLWRLRLLLGRRALPLMTALLLVALLSEAHAWFRHMALHGRQAYGRAENMERAMAEAGQLAQGLGWGLSNSLYAVVYPEIRYFGAPSEAPQEAWVALLPPHLAGALERAPQRVMKRSPNDEPVLLLWADKGLGARWSGIEASLRPLRAPLAEPDAAAERDRRWLGSGQDPLPFAMVLFRDLRRLWMGSELLPQHEAWLRQAAQLSPAPEALMGRYMIGRDAAAALKLLEHVLDRWPDYTPAMEDRVKALEALGRRSEAEEARLEQGRRMRAGAWPIYD